MVTPVSCKFSMIITEEKITFATVLQNYPFVLLKRMMCVYNSNISEDGAMND
jgi:hypothetical protein